MMRILLSCIFLSGISVVGCTESTNQKNIEPRTLSPQPVLENRLPGQYIITLKEGGNSETLTSVFQQYGIKAIQNVSRNRYLIILKQDPGPEIITKQAATSSEIEAVQPNYTYQATPQTQHIPQ